MDIRDNIKLEVIESQPYTGDLNARALDMWITLNGFKMIDPTVTIQVKGYNNGFKDTVVTADDNGKYRYIIPPELQSAGSLKLEVYAKQNDLVKVMGVYYKQVIPNEMGVLVPAEHLPTYEDFYRMYNDVKTGITVNSSNVKITPTGNIQSLNIQDAINELEAEKVNKTDNDLSLSTKSDKVFATNIVKNGDFSNGKTDWVDFRKILSVLNGIGRLYFNNTSGAIDYPNISQPYKFTSGHKYYISFDIVEVNNSKAYSLFQVGMQTVTIPSNVGKFSVVMTANADHTAWYISNAVQPNGTLDVKIKNVEIIDLTITYGNGNEPSKETMDRILAEFPNKFFNGTVELYNAKNLPKFLDDKANKVQEAWITPTLLNGWQNNLVSVNGPVGYYKDSIGIVRLRGMIIAGGAGTVAFTLPTGYRPPYTLYFIASCAGVNVGKITVDTSGNVTIVLYNSYISLEGVEFRAGV